MATTKKKKKKKLAPPQNTKPRKRKKLNSQQEHKNLFQKKKIGKKKIRRINAIYTKATTKSKPVKKSKPKILEHQ